LLSVRSIRWVAPEQEAVARLDEPGIYLLYLYVQCPLNLEIGRLGMFDFPAGHYAYTGSALRGMRQRLVRHLRTEKRRHWHIDFLLDYAEVCAIAVLPTRDRLECALHRLVTERLEGRVVVGGFGSSDCGCPAHLIYAGALAAEQARDRFTRH